MGDRAISLALASLETMGSEAEQADIMFNIRLLETYPDVYRVFCMDFAPEERSFLRALAFILAHAGPFGAIGPTVRALAPSDKVCRLISSRYHELEETLMWTLRRRLGVAFTAEVENAWRSVLREAPGVSRVVAGASREKVVRFRHRPVRVPAVQEV
ncbi:hypothetical protein ASE63_23130 [Bosea sp. Root381]|jgi:hemoglobin-like flavoprotein|uniref:hypothetical protein n=1 Tax=Bosea sp. Root381 TaxID=1736524 RepID=UPI0007022D61|nr:hypothetical protein [Bosea sp. Root381]KRE07142.1 hypothetical protein ASE63_23130 [Bosea sp. Root381]